MHRPTKIDLSHSWKSIKTKNDRTFSQDRAKKIFLGDPNYLGASIFWIKDWRDFVGRTLDSRSSKGGAEPSQISVRIAVGEQLFV